MSVSEPHPQVSRASLGTLRVYLAAGDGAALAAMWGSVLLMSGAGLGRRLACSAAGLLAMWAALGLGGLYRSNVCALPSREVRRTLAASAAGLGAFVLAGWAVGKVEPEPGLVGAAGAAAAVVVLRWRFRRWLRLKRSEGLFLRTVVVVGTNTDSEELATMLTDEPELGYRVGGVVGRRWQERRWSGLPGSAALSDVCAVAGAVRASGVIVVASAVPAGARPHIIEKALAMGLHVQVWPGLSGLSSRRLRVAPVSGVPVLYVEPRRARVWQRAAKRLLDVTVAAALLPLVTPLLVVAAVLIKLDDGGPALHRHQVVGRYGRRMTVFKLRTMVPGAADLLPEVADLNERSGGPLFKASNDPRVTRIGRILRESSVDELPQLWSVLTGKMSLVGPRFALPNEVEQFDDALLRRQTMRPGMTGLWQTDARDNRSFSAYRRLDLFYVDNWSLGMDLAILANTLHIVAAGTARMARTALRAAPAARDEGRTVVPAAGLATGDGAVLREQ